MKRTPITPNFSAFPTIFHNLIKKSALYDSSCSPEARVYFIDCDGGYYLKSAPLGALSREAAQTRYFNQKGLGAEVLAYESDSRDWLLTRRVAGEDCTHSQYIEDPLRLCDLIAECLRKLHETDFSDCPVQDHTKLYLETAEKNYRAGQYDLSYFFNRDASVEDVWQTVQKYGSCLKSDTLLHGDYCLPNIMLDDWRFSGFIDLGNGGVGDRHVDLFWGAWTLNFNLGTDRYRDRFFDAYGRDRVDPEMIKLVSAVEVFG